MMMQIRRAANEGIDSAPIKWIVRLLLPIIVTASLAVFSWNANRVIVTLDTHGAQLNSLSRDVAVVSSQVGDVQRVVDRLITQREADAKSFLQSQVDHEARIRLLEKSK